MTSSMRQMKFYNDQTDDFICFGEHLWTTLYNLGFKF